MEYDDVISEVGIMEVEDRNIDISEVRILEVLHITASDIGGPAYRRSQH